MVTVDENSSISRIDRLYQDWESMDDENDLWDEVDCLAVIVGRDDILYAKSTAFQTWLFGYELVDTLCVFCANEIHILASKKKAEFLKPLESALKKKPHLPALVLHVRNKADNDESNFKTILDAAKQSKKGKKLGIFMKDSFSGEFVDGWNSALDNTKIKKVDVSSAYASVSCSKDNYEIVIIKKACQVTCSVFSKFVRQEIATIVDEEKRVKHSKLADGIDQAIVDTKLLPQGVDADQVEICYPPIIQSGGSYQLKFSTVSSDEKLHFGTIICCFGVRYKSYCSNICRTMFVEPTKEMQDNYSFLVTVYEKVLSSLKDGSVLSEIYSVAYNMIEEERPHLCNHFTRTIGFATGLEFREPSLQLSPKCSAVAKKGMVFCINLGLSNLANESAEEERGKIYSLFIGDTVLVNEDDPATELTAASKKKVSSIAIFLGDDEEEEDNVVTNDLFKGRGSRNTAVLDSRTRTEIGSEHKRKQHQARLGKQINEEARKRMLDGLQDEVSKRPKLSSVVAYKHLSVLPLRENDIQNLKVFVDRKHESVILPVFGVPTPFHVSMIKNISKSEEGSFTFLRINLFYPGSTMGRTDGVTFPNPDATFVKELSFRGSNTGIGLDGGSGLSLSSVYNLIKDVQKSFRTREQEKKELEGYKEQEHLKLSINKGNPRLKDLYIRPLLTSRRVLGVLEAHQNGLRYTTLKGDKVDVIYKNIKHAFFQPSKGEMIVLLHFHLKHPIIIGKKKHKDIQFYTEVGEIVADLGRSHHMHDRDDLMAEQAERELRQRLDTAFDNFRRKIEQLQQCHFDFEKPFRDLGFHGVPFRSTVLLAPTTNCLVHLTEPPPFVATLDEVETVHFERVQFHLKNFDMVFVFKDYKRKVAMVTTIPMKCLDQVKEWLNSCDIRYTEGVQSLNWTKIMKTINDDPEGFFNSGGWSFLDPESEGESQESDSDDSAEYQPSSDDGGNVEEEIGETDSDEDYTSLSEGSESDSDDEDSEESGKDWDELEQEAMKADKESYSIVEEAPSNDRKRSKHHHHSRRDSSQKKKRKR